MGVNANEPSSSQQSAEDLAPDNDLSAAKLAQLKAQAEILQSSLTQGMLDHSVLDQVLVVFLAGNFSSAFVQALGQRAANRGIDLAKQASDLVEKYVKRKDGSAELHICGKSLETATVVITSETPDEARLALLDLDVTAEAIRGKILRWDSDVMAWRADSTGK